MLISCLILWGLAWWGNLSPLYLAMWVMVSVCILTLGVISSLSVLYLFCLLLVSGVGAVLGCDASDAGGCAIGSSLRWRKVVYLALLLLELVWTFQKLCIVNFSPWLVFFFVCQISYTNWANCFEVVLAWGNVPAFLRMRPWTNKKALNLYGLLLAWYVEDADSAPGTLYLLGKVWVDSANGFLSCCARVENVKWRIYVLPRKS